MKQFEIGKGNVVPLPPDAFSSWNGALPANARDENEFQGFVKWRTKWNRFLIKAEFQIGIRMTGITRNNEFVCDYSISLVGFFSLSLFFVQKYKVDLYNKSSLVDRRDRK